jgi:hypothetical protein
MGGSRAEHFTQFNDLHCSNYQYGSLDVPLNGPVVQRTTYATPFSTEYG